MVHASVCGAIDFKACDHSARWWTGVRLKLSMLEQQLQTKVYEVEALRAAMVQSMLDLNTPKYRQEYAIKGVEQYAASAMPWFGAAKKQNETNGQLDDIAQWYAVYGGELKETGGG